jgi:hypothetical protein
MSEACAACFHWTSGVLTHDRGYELGDSFIEFPALLPPELIESPYAFIMLPHAFIVSLEALVSCRRQFGNFLVGFLHLRGDTIELTIGFGRKPRHQLLERYLILGDDLNHSFQAIDSLSMGFGRHTRIVAYRSEQVILAGA